MTARAIETKYKDYRFRSRTEAKWAIFFDAMGIEWEYEPEGYDLGEAGWYLPDFWLPYFKMWVEIKGINPNDDELNKARALCDATRNRVIIFVGNPWFNIVRADFIFDPEEKEVFDQSYYYLGEDGYPELWEKDGYDFEKQDGKGLYYQGWATWGVIGIQQQPELIVLIEGDDARAAQAAKFAYVKARRARFEHGENGTS